MSTELRIALSALAFVLLGVVSVHTPWIPGGARAAEHALRVAAENALAEGGYDWARVAVRGRRIVLAGAAPHEGARADALKAVRASSWPGGPILGGVAAVVDDVTTRAPERSPFLLTASKPDDGPVLVRGVVASARDRERLSERAETMFPSALDVSLDVATGAPAGADWVQGALFGLDLLARLESGRLTLSDLEIRLSGVAVSRERQRLIEGFADMAPRPFTTALNLRVTPPPAAPPETTSATDAAARDDGGAAAAPDAAERAAAPPEDALAGPATAVAAAADAEPRDAPDEETQEPSPVALSPVEAACQAALTAAAPPGAIAFAFNETTFAGDSDAAVLAVVDALAQCGPATVIVGGHTDNRGDPAYNRYLSRRRAEAVVERLSLFNLGEARVRAAGYGDADPIASNATLAGRRANRRISFTVIPARDDGEDARSERPRP